MPVNEIEARLARLTPQQRELLLRRLTSVDPTRDFRGTDGADDQIHLSHAQERLWFLEQMYPGLPVHHVTGLVTIRGSFDPDRFYEALDLVVARHEVLRTSVATTDDGPRQRVHAPRPLERTIHDLVGADPVEDEAARILSAEAQLPPPMDQGLALRAVVMRISDREHRVLVVMHHIASDGWSTSILLRETLEASAFLSRGLSPRLPHLPAQYRDYARWQRARAEKGAYESQLSYWVKQLEGYPGRLELPADRPRPALSTHAGARVHLNVPVQVAVALRAFAAHERVTPFMALLAVYAVLLHRWSAQDDFTIGIPVSGRERQEFEPLIGCFLNLVALRVDLSDNPTFRQFLERVRTSWLAAFENREAPFGLVVSRLRPDRDLNLAPLFQVAFSFERDPSEDLPSDAGVQVSFEEVNLGATRYELSLELTWSQSGLRGWLDYSTDLFETRTAERLAERMQGLLEDVVAHPDHRVGDLRILTNEEERLLKGEWSGRVTDYPREATVHRLYAEQARVTPGAVALLEGDRRVTYAELDRASDLLARRLQRLGVGRRSIVALFVERSCEAIVAILGILKAGGSYLPLDPAQPASRTAHMLREAGVRLAILKPSSWSGAFPLDGIETLDLDASSAWMDSGDLPHSTPPNHGEATDLAYVMYTSGSTGMPKGVAVIHRNVVRLVRGTDYACFGPDEAGLLLAPLAFDASTFEIWGPLLNGGRLVIAPRGPLGFDHIGDLLRSHQVTTLWLTAGLFQGMVQENVAGLATLRQLLSGGDILPMPQVARLLEALPGCRLINGYGPTEGTTFTCCHTVVPADLRRASIPIGRPISNTTVYVLDRYLRRVPTGTPGELYIGGDGVAEGYIGNPDLTNERFLLDPFSIRQGGLMYRSGDRVRLLPDGRVEFLGRGDRQVKIRGFRVEPCEIEVVLSSHPDVREAVVVARDDPSGTKRLHAYVVSRASPMRPSELRSHLRGALPEYMVPASFTELPSLPLTPNGKIDRRLLPTPELEDRRGLAVPRSETELVLARLWMELLHVDQVGSQENFFGLGGDSIQVVQLVSRAARERVLITAQQVFAHQTLAELAVAADRVLATASPSPERASGTVPLTPIQRWFFENYPAGPSRWCQWVMLPLAPSWHSSMVEAALHEVLRRHDAFRLRFHCGPDGWLQHLAEEDQLRFKALDLSDTPVSRRRRALEDASDELLALIDLSAGPLLIGLHVAGFEEVGGVHLLVAAHHLVVDALSWHLFLGELEAACLAMARGAEPELGPLPTSYAHFARSLEGRAAAEQLDQERAFWTSQKWDEAATIPLDRPSGSNLEEDATTLEWRLDRARTLRLKAAQDAYRTRMDDFLVIAFACALGAWSEGGVVLIDVERAGQLGAQGMDLTRSIGWFTELYPVLLDVRLQDPAAVLKVLKGRLRCFAEHASSFGLLRYVSGSGNGLPRVPRAEVVFNFLGEVPSGLELGIYGGLLIRARDPASRRPHAIAVEGGIVEGRLQICMTWSASLHDAKSIEGLRDGFAAALERLVDACDRPDAGGRTPSDFPLARLEQRRLDHLLDHLLAGCGEDSPGRFSRVEDILPLTELQQGLLFHTLRAPRSDAYLVQLLCRLEGPLDVDHLGFAWRAVLHRHAALRCGFHHEGLDSAVQVVQRVHELPIRLIDLATLSPAEQDAVIAKLMAQDRGLPFDLSLPPLMRVLVLRQGERRFTMLWTYHHIILDGWSTALVLRELFSAYQQLQEGVAPIWPAVRPFRDYIRSLEDFDRGAALQAWHGYLGGFEEPTPLALARPEGGAPLSDVAVDEWVPEDDTTTLLAWARSRRLTLAAVLQGVWALVIGSMAGRDDVLFGCVVSGRPPELEGVESMVGLLINTIPRRVRIDVSSAVSDFVSRLQAEQIELQAYERCGLALIQCVSQVRGGRALFESVLVVENYPLSTAESDGRALLTVSGVETVERVEFPLTLMVSLGPSLRLRFLYDASRFSMKGVEEVARKVLTLLRLLPREEADSVSALLRLAGLSPPLPVRSHAPRPRGGPPAGRALQAPAEEMLARLAGIWSDLLGVPEVGPDSDFFDLGGHSLLLMQMRSRIKEELDRDVDIVDLLQQGTLRSMAQLLVRENVDDPGLEEAGRRARARKDRTATRKRTHERGGDIWEKE